MAKILLVQVDQEAAALFLQHVDSELSLEAVADPDAAIEQLEEAPERVRVLILGPKVDEPVRVAQRAGVLKKHLPVMILCEPRHFEQLARAVQFSPFMSSSVSCHSLARKEALAASFREVLVRARQRERYEAMVQAAQDRLTQVQPAQPSSLLYLDRLLSHAPIGVVLVDRAGTIQAWNRQATVIFGVNEREALGKHLPALFPEPQRSRMEELVRAGSSTIEPQLLERVDPAGPPQFVEVTAAAVAGRTGEQGVMFIFQDITARVLAEREAQHLSQKAAVSAALAEQADHLRRLNLDLEQRNRELQEFAYVASHDLQEPLRKIQSFSDLLWEEYSEAVREEGKHYLDRIQESARRMSLLLSDLLAYTRIATRMQPTVRVDLNLILGEVLSDLEILLADVEGRVEVHPLATIEAEPTQMRQLFQNLIGNALKFRRPDVPPVVRVAGKLIETPGAEVPIYEIRVEDNGIGFEEKYLDRIFVPFQRLHARGTYAGTGMGLAICRRIVERHHGKITAESRPGEGSTFVITLPLRQQLDQPSRPLNARVG